jgi:HEAT repeat protein
VEATGAPGPLQQEPAAGPTAKSPPAPAAPPGLQGETQPIKPPPPVEARPADTDGPPELPKKAIDPTPRPVDPAGPAVAADRGQAERPEGMAPLLWRLARADNAQRLQGAALLGRFGTAARDAAPTLDYTLRADPDTAVANEAAVALAKIGRPGVPYLVAALEHERKAVRQRAAAALALAGPEARAAVPALLKALKDDSPQVRAVAARALGEVGGDPQSVAPALCLAFGDVAPEVKQQAGLALVSLGEAAVPGLREALKSPVPALRRDAAQALGMIGSDARAAADDLARLLKDGDAQVRATAAGALAAMGKEAQAAIPALLELLRTEKQFEVQQRAFQAITAIGSQDLPGLLKAVREIDEVGRWAIPYVLTQFGPRARDAVPQLIKLLADPDAGHRVGAALALGKLGAEAREAIPALLQALQDPSPAVRGSAATALTRLDPRREVATEQRLDQTARTLQATAQRLWNTRALLKVAAEPFRGLRPVNRAALTNSAIQARYNSVVDMTLAVSECKAGGIRFMGGDNNKWTTRIQNLIDNFGPEAVPALVRGLNLAGKYNIGFC